MQSKEMERSRGVRRQLEYMKTSTGGVVEDQGIGTPHVASGCRLPNHSCSKKMGEGVCRLSSSRRQ